MAFKVEINFANFNLADKQIKYAKKQAQGFLRVNAVGSLVFNYLKIMEIPTFLSTVISKQGWGSEQTGFFKGPIFEERFNEPNLDIKENDVEIYDIFNNKKDVISKQHFFLIAINFAHKALEAVIWFDLLEKGIVDKQWVNDIKQWIIDNEESILKMQEDENV